MNSSLNQVLFQPWQPIANSAEFHIENDTASVSQPAYIELPNVDNFQELELVPYFKEIKSNFLNDIKKMRVLVCPYVNNKYNVSIDLFYNKIKFPTEDLHDSLLLIYRDTRFHIHKLVIQLEKLKNNTNITHDNNIYITSVLHECLYGIDHCLAGVHSRFSLSFIDLETTHSGLSGKLYKVRKELYHQFIHSFLFEIQRDELVSIPQGMVIHWFNSFHNLACEQLNLKTITDQFAPRNLSKVLINRFIRGALLSVNAFTIVRKLTLDWADKIKLTFQEQGVSDWEFNSIPTVEMDQTRMGTLESAIFKPLNYLLKTTGEQSLNIWALIDDMSDSYSYSLIRYREKLLVWFASYFSSSSAKVFGSISLGVNSVLYIGTIDNSFFWCFEDKPGLALGQECTFDNENHITFTLSHLNSLDFSSWPDAIAYPLLIQAIVQTNTAEQIASFFLQQNNLDELSKISRLLHREISKQLSDKLAYHGDSFKQTLCRCICDQFVRNNITFLSHSFDWLIDTPLLKTVLLFCQKKSIDTSQIKQNLCSWHISDFSSEEIKRLFTESECHRVFKQACKLMQSGVIYNLFLSGHCDNLINFVNEEEVSALAIFAHSGHLSGLKYLLNLENSVVNKKNIHGFTPLHMAARKGHKECVELLVKTDGILINAQDNEGFTPLNSAARNGKATCVRELLKAPEIDIEHKNNYGCTPLNNAAFHGHSGCITELLKAPDIKVNKKDKFGFAPLHYAARFNHTSCVKKLLSVPKIKVNKRDKCGFTPLITAAYSGSYDCIKALLKDPRILVNKSGHLNDTPLFMSIKHANVECAKLLISDQRTNLNTMSYYSFKTPLIKAREKKLQDIVTLLEGDLRLNQSLNTIIGRFRR